MATLSGDAEGENRSQRSVTHETQYYRHIYPEESVVQTEVAFQYKFDREKKIKLSFFINNPIFLINHALEILCT